MATVDKTWVFAADNEGLADVGDTAVSIAHDTSGNPGGSLEFLGANGSTNTHERARRATTGETWETWGVPAGSTVTDVQVVTFEARKWAGTPTTTLGIRVVDSAGASVHSAGDLASQVVTANGWTSFGGSSRAVDAGKQASTTDVRLEVELTLSAASAGVDLGVDNILLRITYTAGGGGTPVTATRALSYDIANTVTAQRGLSYDILNTVTAQRGLSYDIANSVVATRALSYDLIAFVAALRALSYDILNTVAATRGLSYDVLSSSQVAATRGLSYDVLNSVVTSRALSYDLLNSVVASRGLSYDIINAITAQRGLSYDIVNSIVATRALSYDLLNAITAQRVLNYDVLNSVSAQRTLNYDLGNVVVAPGVTRQGLWYW